MNSVPSLPRGIVWKARRFPNANFLFLDGEEPALIDSGFVAHAEATVAMVRRVSSRVPCVVNTHWHSDHVGANQLLQHLGACIIGSRYDAKALELGLPTCCAAEYLDHPVPQYNIDRGVVDRDQLLLGDSEWTVIAAPGHTPGHVALWNSEHRLLAVGDALSAYDVGWVNIMLDGKGALDSALGSLRRLRDLDARVILPGHGPVIEQPREAIETAIGRVKRQLGNIELTINYGARRILAYTLMLRDGMIPEALDAYLWRRDWVRDAAWLLELPVENFVRDLIDSMFASGALSSQHGIIRPTSEYSFVDPGVFDLPLPREWS